jgi:hypothetical protein
MKTVVTDLVGPKKFDPIKVELVLETEAEAGFILAVFNTRKVKVEGAPGDTAWQQLLKVLDNRGIDRYSLPRYDEFQRLFGRI